MTAVVADFSFAWPSITPARLRQVQGCTGFVAYAGCWETSKNISRKAFQALVKAGFAGCLVIEDNAGDLAGGYSVGVDQGKRLLAAAKAIGYDVDNCVLATGYDTDSHSADWPRLLEGMRGFASVIPHPGYYGDSDSIDYLHDRHPGWFYWQSSSGSFSPKNPTGNAHLWQQYDSPLAHVAGLQSSIDVNFVERTPLGFMGEEVDPLSGYTLEQIADAVWARKAKSADGQEHRMDVHLQQARQHAASAAAQATSIAQIVAVLPTRIAAAQKAIDQVAKAVAAIEPAKQLAVDVAAIAAATSTEVVAKLRALVGGA